MIKTNNTIEVSLEEGQSMNYSSMSISWWDFNRYQSVYYIDN